MARLRGLTDLDGPGPQNGSSQNGGQIIGGAFTDALNQVVMRCEELRIATEAAITKGDGERNMSVRLKGKMDSVAEAHEKTMNSLRVQLDAEQREVSKVQAVSKERATEAKMARLDRDKAVECLRVLTAEAQRFGMEVRRSSGTQRPSSMRVGSQLAAANLASGRGTGRSTPTSAVPAATPSDRLSIYEDDILAGFGGGGSRGDADAKGSGPKGLGLDMFDIDDEDDEFDWTALRG